MKKILIAFLLVKFGEKVVSDGLRITKDESGLYSLGESIIIGLLCNTPIVGKLFDSDDLND